VTRILAAASPGEIRLAVLEGDTLTDYALWRPGAPDGLGDVHVGRIIARVPAMAGAFVALAGHADGFLPDSEASRASAGEYLRVRITRCAQGGKGPRVAGCPGEATPPLRLLEHGPTPLDRLAAAHPGAVILVDDAALFARLRAVYPGRLEQCAHGFDEAVESEIEALASQNLTLPGGMRATITPTPALIAIDVDGGSQTAERGAKSKLQMAANRQALPALARQIRLRNLSGAILIDFAGLPARQRASLSPDLAASLAADPARPRLVGFTGLGLAEILRPRHAPPLHELLAGPHAAGLVALRHAARQADRPLVLRASLPVVTALQSDSCALTDLARRRAYPLVLRTDHTLPPNAWAIEDAS
jgi:Ribonuclease G/E